MDLGNTIEPKSDQLNSDDLIMGPMTIRVTKVSGTSNRDQPISVHFEGDSGKPYKPCKSMRRVMVHIWGRDGSAYVGKSMTLYRDEKVRFGGVDVGGIRISHMSHITEDVTMALTASKAIRKPFTVRPLVTEPTTPVDPDVKAAGDEAAKGGVESYTTWLASLTPEVKATVKWLHKEWSRVAKAVVVADGAEVDTPPELSKAESQKADHILAIQELEKDDPERVAVVLDGRNLSAMTPGQVKDLYNSLTA